MGTRVRAIFWVLTAICFSYDLYLWGGLKATPRVGVLLMREARVTAPLAATYMALGEKMNSVLRLTDNAKKFAERHFPQIVAQPEQLESLAVTRVLAAQRGWGSFCYRMFPVLLVLSLLLHWWRQKPIRSFGTK